MELIIKVILFVGVFGIFIVSIAVITSIFTSIRGKEINIDNLKVLIKSSHEEQNKNVFEKMFKLFVAFSIIYCMMDFFNLGNEDLGSLFEKRTFETQYYVYAFPSSDTVKSYKLPADIKRIYSDGKYYVKAAYFPNGGYIYFNDCYIPYGVRSYATDQTGKEWVIELTNQKVKK